MNPRLFCRESSFHKALLLTYSFDPIFFEQVVLPDLWAGRSSDVLVLGDQNQIDMSMLVAKGHLWHLGKKYMLSGAKHTGPFHPKVFLRLGQKDGVVMIGSGNVTSSGWGANQELAAGWMLGPEHEDKGGWLHSFLDDVLSWCSSELEFDAVHRMRDVPWLSLTPAPADEPPVINSLEGRALAPALARRWEGRQFDEVKILTGSTDESGAFLHWAHTTFGVNRATVALTPLAASFNPEKLADLPLDLRLIAAPADRPLHAKFYWFAGKNEQAAVMGSANCSAGAWLLPPNQGGNIETMVAYDAPDAEEFAEALRLFDMPAQNPRDVLVVRPDRTEAEQSTRDEYQLARLYFYSTDFHLQAEIRPAPAAGMSVELLMGGSQLPMTPANESQGIWQCELAEGIGAATSFAAIKVVQDDSSWITAPRWINDLSALQHASQAARLLEPFRGLERGGSSKEQRQMLNELNEVAQILFNDPASFRDPGFGTGGRKNPENHEPPSSPVNPHDLICHLTEPQDSVAHLASSAPGSLSLTGILRLLFESGVDEKPGTGAEQDEQIDEGQLTDTSEPQQATKKAEKKDADDDAGAIEARFKDQLATHIETFLKELSSPAFAERCTATQMVQAVAFPLAVALRGQRHGWVSREDAEKWAVEIFSILFRGKRARANSLLGAVQERYAENGLQSTFNDVVGDGTLWIALVATLGNSDWQGVGSDLEKALVIREIFSARELLASAQPGRVKELLGNIQIEGARSYVTDIAPNVSRLLKEIEDVLTPIWIAEMGEQAERSITHEVSDFLWRENWGWAICLAATEDRNGQLIKVRLRGQETDVMGGYYVNVTELASRHEDLARIIEQIRQMTSQPLASESR